MNNKTLKILVLIFFVLLAIVFFPSLQSRIPVPKANQEILFTQFTKDSTGKVVLSDQTKEVTLDKDGNSWKVASYSASVDKIDTLFRNLSEATVESLVSNNPANASEYGISSASATRLQLGNSSSKTTVLIGNSGPTADSFYAQKEGSANIYLLSGGLKDVLSTRISEWRDRVIARLSSDQIQKVEVTGISPFSLEKNKEGKWDNDVQEVIGRLSSLTASDFYTEEEAQALQQSDNRRTVTYFAQDGKALLTLTVIPEDAYYLVIAKDKTDLYKVAGYNLDDFFKMSQP